MHGDGEEVDLVINSVDEQGNLAGTVHEQHIKIGKFDRQSGHIRFSVTDIYLEDTKSYDGYISIIGTDVDSHQFFLAGHYSISGANTYPHTYGWFATPEKLLK
jgi:hypothetical protein